MTFDFRKFLSRINKRFFNQVVFAQLNLWLPDYEGMWQFLSFKELSYVLKLHNCCGFKRLEEDCSDEWKTYYAIILNITSQCAKWQWSDDVVLGAEKLLRQADLKACDYVFPLGGIKQRKLMWDGMSEYVLSDNGQFLGNSAVMQESQALFTEYPELRLLAPLGVVRNGYCYFRG
jgi:hypothetical protein